MIRFMTTFVTTFLAALAVAAALTPGPTLAKQDKPKGHGQGGGADRGAETVVDLSIVFGADEQRTIRDYFRSHPYDAKPLPPGIAKNLRRGKPLPPGIAKRYLPNELSRRLPDRPDHIRVIVGDDIFLVETSVNVIVDIIENVF